MSTRSPWTYAQFLAEAERLHFETTFRTAVQNIGLANTMRSLPAVMSQHALDPLERYELYALASRLCAEMAQRVTGEVYEAPLQEGVGDA